MPSAITAGEVMDLAGALLNDPSVRIFTYTKQLPYLKMAYDELGQLLEENNVEAINALSTALTITTAMTDIGGNTGPALPSDLILPETLYERLSGSSSDYIEMKKVDFLPTTVTLTNDLIWWAWQNQVINFSGALTNRQVKIEYLGNTLVAVSSQTSPIYLFNAKNFLAERTAALCADFIGEDTERAQKLNGLAGSSLDRVININVKGEQATPVRRRPFLASYNRR